MVLYPKVAEGDGPSEPSDEFDSRRLHYEFSDGLHRLELCFFARV